MSNCPTTKSLLSLVLVAVISYATVAYGQWASANISREHAKALFDFVASGGAQASSIPDFKITNVEQLRPMLLTTGIHCVLPSESESYHGIELEVSDSKGSVRQILRFTVSPPFPQMGSPRNLSELFGSRKVTQYQVWESIPGDPKHGRVLNYHSRGNRSVCEFAG
jgi:hypothetical protein